MGNEENEYQTAHDHKNPANKAFVFLSQSEVQYREFHPKE
jgi:hypothetical protein